MAAPSNKPSPSSKSVEASSASTAEVPEKASVVSTETTQPKLKDPPPSSLSPEPTYETSQKSNDYLAARALLNEGSFEDALTHIEQGMEATRHVLSSLSMSEDQITFHPSMAPFHYLYGTTLLYSLEESTDTTAVTNTNADGEDVVEDVQIAWENLELARSILERHEQLQPFTLDLAQIYLRQADLHRMNGNYQQAIQDYDACLHHRTHHFSTPFDRKIADVHYNLGLAHMLLVAEQQNLAEAPPNTTTPETDTPKPLSPQELTQHRQASIEHYWQCARALGGLVAILCQQDPHDFLRHAEASFTNLKSTGEDKDDNAASGKLTALRQNIQNLTTTTPSDQEEVQDMVQVLNEIQETIDEAENSFQGVHQVAELKAEITAAAAASVQDEQPAFDPPTTTTTAVAQTLAVKKKPKKRPAIQEAPADTKRPKSAE